MDVQVILLQRSCVNEQWSTEGCSIPRPLLIPEITQSLAILPAVPQSVKAPLRLCRLKDH